MTINILAMPGVDHIDMLGDIANNRSFSGLFGGGSGRSLAFIVRGGCDLSTLAYDRNIISGVGISEKIKRDCLVWVIFSSIPKDIKWKSRESILSFGDSLLRVTPRSYQELLFRKEYDRLEVSLPVRY